MRQVRHPQEPDDDATIVDPQVIADRRARRAGRAEEGGATQAAKPPPLSAAQAQQDVQHTQRAALAARLKQAECDLRAARQGEHAEAQRRLEMEADLGAVCYQAVQEVARLRAALATSRLRVRELEDELARVTAAAPPPSLAPPRRTPGEETPPGAAAAGTPVATSVLEDLSSAALLLRDELQGLEDERVQMRAQLAAARAQVAERDKRSAQDAAARERFSAQLAEMQAQVGTMGEQFIVAAAALTRHLAAEDHADAADGTATPAPLPGRVLAADHPALADALAVAAASEGADSVIIDLARAAARLRIRPEAEGREETGRGPAAAEAPPPESKESAVDVEVRRQVGPGALGAWPLTPSLTALTRGDGAAGAEMIQKLIPAQAVRLQRDLAYDLLMEGHPDLRVTLRRDGTAVVAPRAPDASDRDVAFALTGTASALAPLAGGGMAGRRPAGVALSGRRRRARRLIRSLRKPVGFADLDAAGLVLDPVDVLVLVLAAIDATVTKDERFVVGFAGIDGPLYGHVVVGDGRPVAVHAGPPTPAPAATVRIAGGALAGFLTAEQPARVSGDPATVQKLLAWIDAAPDADR